MLNIAGTLRCLASCDMERLHHCETVSPFMTESHNERITCHWLEVAHGIVGVGNTVVQDSDRLTTGSSPDRVYDDALLRVRAAFEEVGGMVRAGKLPSEGAPDTTRFDDLEDRLEELATSWYNANYDGFPWDDWFLEDCYLDLIRQPSVSMISFLERHRVGLKAGLVTAILSSAGREQFGSTPAGVFVAGVWRLFRDLFLAANYTATRFAGDDHRTLLEAFDKDQVMGWMVHHRLYDLGNELRVETERTLDLARDALVDPFDLSPYLSMIRRCYVKGFASECIIVCRAMLENALRMTYKRVGVISPKGLPDQIDDAGRREWLTPQLRILAHRVRKRGNKVAHGQSDTRADAWDTIASTLRIVQHISDQTSA